MQKRSVKSNNRLVTKKKRRRTVDPATRQLVLQIIGGIILFSLVLLLLTGVWYGSRVSTLTLHTITVEGGQTISHEQVRIAVAGTLEGNYFGLVPKRFAWTYPQESAILAAAAISRVKDPVVQRISGTELRVVIDEYIPFALWCKEEKDGEGCYFIDKEGVAFAVAPDLEGSSMYRFHSLGKEPAINESLRDRETLGSIVLVAESLESDFAMPISEIELDMVGDVFYKVVGGGEIKMTTSQSPTKVIENLALVLSTDDFTTLKAGTFQYIDLRFGNKVFVNDTTPQVTAFASSTIATSSALDLLVTDAVLSTAPIPEVAGDGEISVLPDVLEEEPVDAAVVQDEDAESDAVTNEEDEIESDE